ncbi:MAG TPA: DUF72 domain-containing protein [Candidatus Limnocylindria bacterium]|nr:DUF72 domain-containing protein [Candidatus Limnocylindria bacterium]
MPTTTTTTNPHDPGPDVAGRRGEAHAEAAREPIRTNGSTIRLGTASWTDPTMTAPGVFYPPDANTAEERLVHYANQFPIVEVDATYYALPARRQGELWLERTPPDFTFDIKAHALMTGQPSEPKRLPKDIRESLPPDILDQKRVYARDLPKDVEDEIWNRFLDGIEPLRSSGKLGAVFLQYPRWFFPTSESREEILTARERLGDTPFAVELRHASWFNEKNRERTIRFFESEQIPYVIVDAPPGTKSSVPPVTLVSSPKLSVIRFHGRRSETWEKSGIPVVERFRYLYDEGELSEWVPRIQEVAGRVPEVHVLMNNCYANYGTTNAREIADLLASSIPRLDR